MDRSLPFLAVTTLPDVPGGSRVLLIRVTDASGGIQESGTADHVFTLR